MIKHEKMNISKHCKLPRTMVSVRILDKSPIGCYWRTAIEMHRTAIEMHPPLSKTAQTHKLRYHSSNTP